MIHLIQSTRSVPNIAVEKEKTKERQQVRPSSLVRRRTIAKTGVGPSMGSSVARFIAPIIVRSGVSKRGEHQPLLYDPDDSGFCREKDPILVQGVELDLLGAAL